LRPSSSARCGTGGSEARPGLFVSVPLAFCWCDAAVTDDELAQIARLLTERNAIDDTIAAIIDRPMTSGHLGEWIAAQVFDIELERSAATAAIDGRFRSGPYTVRP
jgi:hypothetical protein